MDTHDAWIRLNTAGGHISAAHSISMCINESSETIHVVILPNTPNVVSLGRLCVERGFSFWWPAHSKSPVFTTPTGKALHCSVYSNIQYIENVDGCVVAATDGKGSMGLYHAAPPSPTKTADSNIQLTGMFGSLSRALAAMDIQAPLVVGCRSESRNSTFDVPTGKLLQATRNFLCATSHTSGLPKEFSTLRISRMSTIKPYAPAAPDVTSSIMVIGLWTGHATNKQGKRCVILLFSTKFQLALRCQQEVWRVMRSCSS